MSSAPKQSPPGSPPRRVMRTPLTPRLRLLLLVTLFLFALVAFNSIYLAGVTFTQWRSGASRENGFYQWMFLGHLALGLLITVPAVLFGILHWRRSHDHPNRRAVRMGLVAFAAALATLVTGFLLTRVEVGGLTVELRRPEARSIAYWAHVGAPLLLVWAFVLHRLAGRRMRWRTGLAVAAASVALVVGFNAWHDFDASRPRPGPRDGAAYYEPSLARTANGAFLSERSLMQNDTCLECHPDAYRSWAHSAHAASSFNNPMYAFSVRETRRVAFAKEQSVQDARFCAGCHDPVPFFTGAFEASRFDDPEYDVSADPLGAASITCTSCHAIVGVGSTRGNADYVIEESPQYPFAFSEQPFLRWVNRQLIKAKPAFHKHTYLKPQVHRSAEFCSTCHKVFLPEQVNDYKWLQGQDHYDSWRLSNRSGIGVLGWYWPKEPATNCNGCHMPAATASAGEFGAKPRGPQGELQVMNHQFLGANTAMPTLAKQPEAAEAIAATERFNQGVLRLDLFGLREGGLAEGAQVAPLAPGTTGVALRPGARYLLEVLVRTLGTMGHEFTQGTADSNEVWLEVELRDARGPIARMGGFDERRAVDAWTKFFNVYMLDREGRRIDRRNPQDIFVPLYNHQVPPGAADLTRVAFTVPPDAQGPITVSAWVHYRKFDTTYLTHVFPETAQNTLPVMTLAQATVVFDVGKAPAATPTAAPAATGAPAAPAGPPEWERWYDAAIGAFRVADRAGDKGQWGVADDAFRRVAELGRVEGWIGRARVALRDGRVAEAAEFLRTAATKHPGELPWAAAYWSAVVDFQQGAFERAAQGFRTVNATAFAQAHERGYDFSRDDRVLVEWATANLERARQLRDDPAAGRALLQEAVALTDRALALDSQRAATWYVRTQALEALGDAAAAATARAAYETYRPDDNARDRAVNLARQRDPAANHAAEPAAIYELQRPGAPTLPVRADTRP
ncbi:MAG: multiheme c-type cytochrome [Phycisphaerales bacterium]